jgi:pimeloyl-ACP methyl ester carboxylesterase
VISCTGIGFGFCLLKRKEWQALYSRSVVFITGTFIGNNCWDDWISYFEKAGYKCIAPAWPYKEAPAEELRNRPANDPIALNTLTSLTDHFASIINGLQEKPILIGHSIGGLLVQLLLQKDWELRAPLFIHFLARY